jgi:hypothetical protein
MGLSLPRLDFDLVLITLEDRRQSAVSTYTPMNNFFSNYASFSNNFSKKRTKKNPWKCHFVVEFTDQ